MSDDADRCWSDEIYDVWGFDVEAPCCEPGAAPLGLCPTHYREIVGTKETLSR